jgi:hypothetical protein
LTSSFGDVKSATEVAEQKIWFSIKNTYVTQMMTLTKGSESPSRKSANLL